MATPQQAQASLDQEKQQIQGALAQIQQNRGNLTLQEQQAEAIQNKTIPQRRIFPTVTRAQQLQVQANNEANQQAKAQALNQIQQARAQLNTQEQQVNQADTQVSQQQDQLNVIKQQQDDYNKALNLFDAYTRGNSASAFASLILSQNQLKIYRELISNYKAYQNYYNSKVNNVTTQPAPNLPSVTSQVQVVAPTKTTAIPLSIVPGKNLTPQEQSNNNFYNQFYGKVGAISKDIGDFLGNIKDYVTSLFQPQTQQQAFNQAFGTFATGTGTGTGGRGTSTYGQLPNAQLSDEALLLRLRESQELPQQLNLQKTINDLSTNIIAKYTDIAKQDVTKNNISNPAQLNKLLTDLNTQANAEFQQQANMQVQTYNTGFTQREQQRQQEIANRYQTSFDLYVQGKIPASPIDITTQGDALAKITYDALKGKVPDFVLIPAISYTENKIATFQGVYDALRTQPTEILKNIAIGAGLTVATEGAYTVIGEAGLEDTLLAQAGKFALEKGLPTVYGASILTQSLGANAVQTSYNLGKIATTQVGPFVLGGISGAKAYEFALEPIAIPQPSEYSERLVKTVQPKLQIFKADVLERLYDVSIGKSDVLVYRPSAYQIQGTELSKFVASLLDKTGFAYSPDFFFDKVFLNEPALYKISSAPGKEGLIISKATQDVLGRDIQQIINSPLLYVQKINEGGIPSEVRNYYLLQGSQLPVDLLKTPNLESFEKQLVGTQLLGKEAKTYFEFIETTKLGKVKVSSSLGLAETGKPLLDEDIIKNLDIEITKALPGSTIKIGRAHV
jgi:hypothetical protein